MTVKMSGKFLAMCVTEPGAMQLVETREEGQQVINEWFADEELELTDIYGPVEDQEDFGVIELSEGALKLWFVTPWFMENCPLVDGKLYTIRETRELIAAGELPKDALDPGMEEFEATTEAITTEAE